MKTNETNTGKPNGTGTEPASQQESHNANESIKNEEGELNEAGARATAEQESQNTNGTSAEEDPTKKHPLKRILVFLLVAAVVVVPAMLIIKSCQQKAYDEEYYDYSYGEEPSDGYVSYKSGKSNIINPTTKEVIVKDIDWCHYSSNSDEEPIVLFAKDGKRGFCNIATNEIIVSPTTYTKAWVFSEGLAAVERMGYIGFVNTSGKVAIDFRFSYRGNNLYEFVFHNGYCVVADSSNKIGVINQKGRWVIKPLYDDIELTKDYAIVYKEGEFKKQIDFQGHVLQDGIIDDIYDLEYDVQYTDLQTGEPSVGYAKNENFYEYRVGSYSGLIDSKGKIITPPIYTDISGITSTLFRARLQDWTSIVIIDTKGNVISTIAK